MFFALTKGPGPRMLIANICLKSFPVIGKVPLVLPNIGLSQTAEVKSKKMQIMGMPPLTVSSKIKKTLGDLVADGGVISNKVGDQIDTLNGSKKVYVGGEPIALMVSPSTQNAKNGMGMVLKEYQNKMLVGQ